MNLLQTLGLMKRSEHEAWQRQRDDIYKRAATDLAAEVKERKKVQYDLARARLEIEALRPDALAMRKKRAADRKRMAGKRGKDNG